MAPDSEQFASMFWGTWINDTTHNWISSMPPAFHRWLSLAREWVTITVGVQWQYGHVRLPGLIEGTTQSMLGFIKILSDILGEAGATLDSFHMLCKGARIIALDMRDSVEWLDKLTLCMKHASVDSVEGPALQQLVSRVEDMGHEDREARSALLLEAAQKHKTWTTEKAFRLTRCGSIFEILGPFFGDLWPPSHRSSVPHRHPIVLPG